MSIDQTFDRLLLLGAFHPGEERKLIDGDDDDDQTSFENDGNHFRVVDIASKDVVLCTFAFRCKYRRATYEVGFFECADSNLFELDSAVRIGILALFIQAYRLTASMRVLFSSSKGKGVSQSKDQSFEDRIPQKIREYALKYGVQFEDARAISNDEARKLFERMSFTPKGFRMISASGLSPVLIGFLVHRRTWTPNELTAIFAYCSDPRLVLSGDISNDLGLLFDRQKLALRNIYLAERVLNHLQMELSQSFPVVASNQNALSFVWEKSNVVIFRSAVALSVESISNRRLQITAGVDVRIGLFPADNREYDFQIWLQGVLEQFTGVDALFVTQSIQSARPNSYKRLLNFCNNQSISLLTVSLTTGTIDAEVRNKIKRSSNLLVAMEMIANG